MSSADERREALKACFLGAQECTRCPELVAARTQVVLGAGRTDADLVFVGEAPGREEDLLGVPLAGRAGLLLGDLLAEIGLSREDVFVTNLLMCRPPDNRDPTPGELDRCQDWLLSTLDLVRPRVVCPLGNFATKLLRGSPEPITSVHGRTEVRVLGERAVRLHPLFHPAAALYRDAGVQALRRDMARLPALLELPEPEQPGPAADEPVAPVALASDPSGDAPAPAVQQLGLF